MPDLSLPTPGDSIILVVPADPHRGEYTVTVLESTREKISVTMPTRDGLIVPLAGGSLVIVKGGNNSYHGQVLGRSFGDNINTLFISSPGALSLAGRTHENNDGARFIAITSGKGGVGKSTLSTNLGLALSQLGLRVCLVDVDLGTANLDLMLGIPATANLGDIIDGKPVEEVLVSINPTLTLLPGSSGVDQVANLNQWQISRLLSSFNKLSANFDLVLLDTGAGVSRNVTDFLQAADQVLLVTTPDPTAITDAYALAKVMTANQKLTSSWHLVINKAGESEAHLLQANFCRTALRHLGAMIFYLGYIPESRAIASSVKKQHPYLLWGGGEEARAYHNLARRLTGLPPERKSFLQRFQKALQFTP